MKELMDAQVTEQARQAIERRVARGELPRIDVQSVEDAYLPLCQVLAEAAKSSERPHIVAIVGAPGSGKTTLSAYLQCLLPEVFGLSAVGFSLDDLYLSSSARQRLARDIHPLFAVRGAPGTHNIDLGLRTLKRLREAAPDTITALPRFDKMFDEPVPETEWPIFEGCPDVILIDSWIWNVEPPSAHNLIQPLNEREKNDDPNGVWRKASAQALGRGYPELFAQAEKWVLFEPPSWEATVRFREEQEEGNRAALSEAERKIREAGPAVRHFLELFQRWSTLPHTGEPDVRIGLDESHRATLIQSP